MKPKQVLAKQYTITNVFSVYGIEFHILAIYEGQTVILEMMAS